MKRPKLIPLLILLMATTFFSIMSLAISQSDQSTSNNQQMSTLAPVARLKSPRSRSSSSSTTPRQAQQEPLAYIQEQVRIMAGYNNTPPVFATATRDFFVDVGRQPLGTRIATIRAIDLEGDQIEYSIKRAIYKDASSYFSMNSTSGELRLANKQFKYFLPTPMNKNSSFDNNNNNYNNNDNNNTNNNHNQGVSVESDYEESDEDVDDDDDDGEENDDYETSSTPSDETQRISSMNYLRKNVYYLTVSADDGHLANNIELQIHIINSSAIQTIKNLPVQLAPTNEFNKNMLNIIRTKTNEYYDRLNNLTTINKRTMNNSATIVYPNYMNPGLRIPNEEQSSTLRLNNNSNNNNNNNNNKEAIVIKGQPTSSTTQSPSSIVKTMTQLVPNPLLQEHDSNNSKYSASPLTQQMVVTLVVACSILTIALVLLMFLIPLSVKRLRRRLKNVELQHEHLSKKASNGSSSFVCSSHCSVGSTSGTIGTTHNNHNNHHHHHNSSLSQFTQSSTNQLDCQMRSMSSVCRQSSLDSSTTTVLSSTANNPTTISRTIFNDSNLHKSNCHDYNQQAASALMMMQSNNNNHHHNQNKMINSGSIITNPVYLQEQSNQFLQQHHRKEAVFPTQIMQAHSYQISQQQQQAGIAQQLNNFNHLTNQTSQQMLDNNNNNNNCYNVYYPIDDEVYSTIQTNDFTPATNGNENHCHKHEPIMVNNYFKNSKLNYEAKEANSQCKQQKDLMRSESPNGSESGSSTRSLARFLSLPARHAAHNGTDNSRNTKNNNFINSDSSNDIFSQLDSYRGNNDQQQQQNYLAGSKTVARASSLYREQYNQTNSNHNNEQKNWEIERHRIKFIQMLDKGQFGLVWRGILRKDNHHEQTVAVKMLSNASSKNERDRQELLAEIDIMKLVCQHPNVVELLYCCTIDSNIETRPIWLIMEYVELGKLQKYLQNSRKNHYYATTTTFMIQNNNNNTDENNKEDNSYSFEGDNNSIIQTNYHVTSKDLLKFIYHVAKGMEYLASKCIVHRDLASRNILVSVDKICKIGDFGMARHMQSLNGVYERHSKNTKIPVRWMAPEVLLENRFTIESDVYSLGILMWEIVTLGSTPYSDLKTEQVIDEVARKGQRPERPEYCHQDLYKIMSSCWSNESKRRPTFRSLVKQLDNLLLSANDYIELDQYPDHNYYNISEALAPNELL